MLAERQRRFIVWLKTGGAHKIPSALREPLPPRPKCQGWMSAGLSKLRRGLGFLGGSESGLCPLRGAKARLSGHLSALLPASLARERERMCEGKPYGFPSRSINPPHPKGISSPLCGSGTATDFGTLPKSAGSGDRVPRPSRPGAKPPSPVPRRRGAKKGHVLRRSTPRTGDPR